jgi:peptidoglycan/LPS O-acetylase OafA/YrhL
MGGPAFAVLAFGTSALAAVLVYKFVERPLLAMTRRKSRPVSSTAA